MKELCCGLVEKLGKRLAALNDELRQPGHRSFRKLAEAYGLAGQKSAIERHKHRCLRVGAPFEAPPVQDPPARTVRVDPPESVPEMSLGHAATAGIPSADPPRARAPEVVVDAKTLEERMAHIVSQMLAGTWDSARDTPRCAAAWGLHEDTVRHTVSHIFAARRLNRGDMAQREEEALAFYAWQLGELQATLLTCETPDETAKVHARITEVRARMDAIAVPRAQTVNNFNFGTDPRFIEAAHRYVDTVHGVLGSTSEIVERVAKRLKTPIPAEAVEAVLAEAAELLLERVSPVAAPELPEQVTGSS